ncbi:uncharacterized protein VTP21DRAFT_935 [Calcarisporiella thermophila]|uniref:uncharacterized protein n=1 Tax=Calcarisporiella thermophila TaxID=911321 RepID=UPI003742A6C2
MRVIKEKPQDNDIVCQYQQSLKGYRKRFPIAILVLSTLGFFNLFYLRFPRPFIKEYCTEPVCLETAAGILRDLNSSASPCDDFYTFVCGRFNEQHRIPPDSSKWRVMDEVQKENLLAIRDILEGDYENIGVSGLSQVEERSDREVFEKAKAVYDVCMRSSSNEEDANKMIPVLNLVLKGFPLPRPLPDYFSGDVAKFSVDDDKVTKSRLGYVLGLLANYGVNALFQYEPWMDVNITRLWLLQPRFGLPALSFYQNETMVNAYSTAIAETFLKLMEDVTIWPDEPKFDPKIWSIISRHIIGFEKQLIEHTLAPQQKDNPSFTYNLMNTTMLQQLAPILDWDSHFKHLYANVSPTPLNVDVVVGWPDYIGNLSLIVTNTPAYTLQAFLLWRIISEYANYLPEKQRKPLHKLNEILSGTKSGITAPRWRTCIGEVSNAIWHIPARYFAIRHFGPSGKHALMEMLENIRQTFIQNLPHLDWLDDQTRANALTKALKIKAMAGYPSKSPDVMSPSSLQSYYANFTAHNEDYLATGISGRAFKFNKFVQLLGKVPDRYIWEMVSYQVGAYYWPSIAHLAIPSGIAQAPFFHIDLPSYINYGAVGGVIGHEITHGFDNLGRKYDSLGAVQNWWSEEASRNFERKAQCFVDQYSNFTIRAPNGSAVALDGLNTLSEDIADNGGILQAYLAWKKNLQSNRQDKLLPGLDYYTPEQLFFIARVRYHCGYTSPEMRLQQVLTDEHSPDEFRVNGVAMNSAEFARAWKCPIGSPMNPKKKCLLW